jgi:hypothetical protein
MSLSEDFVTVETGCTYLLGNEWVMLLTLFSLGLIINTRLEEKLRQTISSKVSKL